MVKGHLIVIIQHTGLNNEMEAQGSSTAPCYINYRKGYFYTNIHELVVYLCIFLRQVAVNSSNMVVMILCSAFKY